MAHMPLQDLLPDRTHGSPGTDIWLGWPLLAGVSLLLLFLTVSVTPVTNNDIWLHMSTGRWILEHGQVPLTDPFSFSAHGHRYHAHEWLAGVIFEEVHRLFGIAGLIGLKTGLGGLALLLCAATARRWGASWSATFGCTWLALVIVNSRFLVRPEMFSYVLTALYLAVLAAEHGRLHDPPGSSMAGRQRGAVRFLGSSLLWYLVPAQWAWTQLHGYFLTGLALVGLFLAATWAERL
ncbi:MAG: hypothetical protein ACE5ID_10085, partial [Acidobacteriota bacterium]